MDIFGRRKYDDEGRRWKRIEYAPINPSGKSLWAGERTVLSWFGDSRGFLEEEVLIAVGEEKGIAEEEVLKNLRGLVNKGYLMQAYKDF